MDEKYACLRLENQLCFPLYACAKEVVRQYREPLEKLADQGQLMSYMHKGFWQCMDNVREKETLEKLLAADKAPWKRWD